MQELKFVKTHGIGNDFIIVDYLQTETDGASPADLAVRICDRNFGIGADGLIIVHPSDVADFRMQIINPDGSEAEMCGNGIRCFARYLLNHGLGRTPLAVETAAGIKNIDIVFDGLRATGFRVNMGAPQLQAEDIPVCGYEGQVVSRPLDVGGSRFDITCVSMGNPHCVIFADSVEDIPLETVGPLIETHPAFPRKTNVEFVQMLKSDEIRIRVWERGAGITLACGTGACASVVAGVLNSRVDRRCTAHLPGGDLLIEWHEDGNAYMTGPAEEVFSGTIRL